MTQPRNSLVARLRAKLSHACVDALQPDLIIMDEFQRFRDLLHGDSDAAILARELFDYSGSDGHAARTLLLSATPYRMLTLIGDEPDEGDHYQDFLETLSFLYGRTRDRKLPQLWRTRCAPSGDSCMACPRRAPLRSRPDRRLSSACAG